MDFRRSKYRHPRTGIVEVHGKRECGCRVCRRLAKDRRALRKAGRELRRQAIREVTEEVVDRREREAMERLLEHDVAQKNT